MNLQNISNENNKLSKTALNVNKNSYQLEVLDIITDLFLLSNQSQLSEPEKVAMAHIWTEFLVEIIPIDELQISFKKAVELHKGDYPLNAFSLKNAWKEIEKLQCQILDINQCPDCTGDGFIKIDKNNAKQCQHLNLKISSHPA